LTYRELWRGAVWNFALGMLVSVVPALAFYYLAFDYTPAQLRRLSWLAIPGITALLVVDLSVLAATLRPVRRALATDASPVDYQRGLERLLALPMLVLPRIFGPHAITATVVFNLLVLWANRAYGLGIPESHFLRYWLLNLTVVPVGHAVYEYHATERLIRPLMPLLLPRLPGRFDPSRLVRLPLASRIFLFSVLLGLDPLVIGGFIAYQRAEAAGLTLPTVFAFQLVAVGAALTMLWLVLLLVISREVSEQTHAITDGLDRIASGDLSTDVSVRSTSEFGRIALAVNEMTAGLRERQRLRQDLAVAREIQQGLLPQRFPPYLHLQVTGLNRPALAVGGDYFDLMELSPDRTAFIMADVCGKGVGAALLSAILQGTFSSMTPGQEPASVFAQINRFICAHSHAPRYATLFFGLLDKAGRLEFINAGHLPPILVHEGQAQFAFPAGTLPLGLFPEVEFKTCSSSLQPGDTLVLFTDGLNEAVNPEGEQFGMERLQEEVARNATAGVDGLQAAILTAVEKFTRGVPQPDDLTLLIIHYRGWHGAE